jgi:hypothetical protein
LAKTGKPELYREHRHYDTLFADGQTSGDDSGAVKLNKPNQITPALRQLRFVGGPGNTISPQFGYRFWRRLIWILLYLRVPGIAVTARIGNNNAAGFFTIHWQQLESYTLIGAPLIAPQLDGLYAGCLMQGA